MLQLTPQMRILVAVEAVDFRRLRLYRLVKDLAVAPRIRFFRRLAELQVTPELHPVSCKGL